MNIFKLMVILITFQFLSSLSYASQNKLPSLNCKFNNKNTLYKTRVDLNTNTIRFNQAPDDVKGNEYNYHYLNSYTLAFGEKGRKNFSKNTDNNSYIIHNNIAHGSASLFIISMNSSSVLKIKGSCNI